MTDPYVLNSLTVSGFRAYLQPKTFDFSGKKSLAIFAPNGKGKSSLVDALEFMFSDEGTLERIGIRTINNNAGVVALPHNLAEDLDIESSVSVTFSKANALHSGKRLASGNRARPDVATDIKSRLVVDPIIRGYGLRQFVEKRTAEERYEDVARWLDLGVLVDLQTKLRELRRKVKAASEDKTEQRQVDTQLARRTGQSIKVWDDAKVLAHVNAMVAALDQKLSLSAISPNDPVVATLKARADEEAAKVGLVALRQRQNAAHALLKEDGDKSVGAIPALESAVLTLSSAAARETTERAAAANAVFKQVWESAQTLFGEGVEAPSECPVCATPIERTEAGSVEGIRNHLSTHLKELTEYASAKKALDTATTALGQRKLAVTNALTVLTGLLSDADAELTSASAAYSSAVVQTSVDVEVADRFMSLLRIYQASIAGEIERLEKGQGESTYAKANATLQWAIELKGDLETARRKQTELKNLHGQLQSQCQFIGGQIRTEVQSVLDTLEIPMNDIYKRIQREQAIAIRLELPPDEDANQQRLNLIVNFAKNREGVQPAGYLSDSQIHSLALALRLAAIRLCNAEVPIAILDDIVTSYDADHRLAFSALIAEEFGGLQFVLVTHDERFFLYLKDRVGDQGWHYARILRIEPGHGPRFADERVSDEMIEKRWRDGESAANDMRQAEEEWLLGICREFGVDVRIRTVEKAYSYERSELASALAAFLSDRKLVPPQVEGVSNRFLKSLQSGVVENFGSHFQDAQYGAGSIGDEKARWAEFVAFRDLFVCPACGRRRFKRPNVGVSRPLCAAENCETPFSFRQRIQAGAADRATQ